MASVNSCRQEGDNQPSIAVLTRLGFTKFSRTDSEFLFRLETPDNNEMVAGHPTPVK